MENNYYTDIIAKKLSSMVRAVLYTVGKSICKRKLLLLDLNLMVKRGKFALGNLTFHHHRNNRGTISSIDNHKVKENEFSRRSNTAQFMTRPFRFTKRSKKQKKNSGNEEMEDLEGVSHVLEMMLNANNYEEKDVGVQPLASPSPSPFLQKGLSFRKRSPMVRQLRITDSPYPLQDTKEDGTDHVDEEAEAFIQRFYHRLQRQMSSNQG